GADRVRRRRRIPRPRDPREVGRHARGRRPRVRSRQHHDAGRGRARAGGPRDPVGQSQQPSHPQRPPSGLRPDERLSPRVPGRSWAGRGRPRGGCQGSQAGERSGRPRGCAGGRRARLLGSRLRAARVVSHWVPYRPLPARPRQPRVPRTRASARRVRANRPLRVCNRRNGPPPSLRCPNGPGCMQPTTTELIPYPSGGKDPGRMADACAVEGASADGSASGPAIGQLSCSMASTLVRYVRTTLGEEAVDQVLRLAGVEYDAAYLEDVSHWIWLDEAVALLKAAAEVTDDPAVGRRVGEESVRQHAGTPVATLLRSLGSPEAVYEQLAVGVTKFSTITELIPREVAPG